MDPLGIPDRRRLRRKLTFWRAAALLILAGGAPSDDESLRRARTFGVQVFSIADERDLKIWTRNPHERRRT